MKDNSMKVLFVSGYDLNGTNANVLCFRNVIEKIDKYKNDMNPVS